MDDVTLASAQHFILCTLCDGNVEYHCNTCHDDLCSTCRRGHLRSNATKDHDVVIYSEKRVQSNPEEKSVRTEPGEKLVRMEPDERRMRTEPEEKRVQVEPEEKWVWTEPEKKRVQAEPEGKWVWTEPEEKKVQAEPEEKRLQAEPAEKWVWTEPEEKRVQAESEEKWVWMEHGKKRVQADPKGEDNKSKILTRRNSETGVRTVHSESVTEKNRLNEENVGISVTELRKDDVSLKPAQCAKKDDNSKITKTVEKREFSAQYATEILSTTPFPESKDSSNDDKPDLVSAQWANVTQSDESSNLIPTLTWQKTIRLPILNSCHISCVPSNKIWVSDVSGFLHLLGLHGNVLETLQTRSGVGFHTVTSDGVLLYTDTENKRILKVQIKQTSSRVSKTSIKAVTFRKTGNWTPLCIFSSRYTGDLLVGMLNGGRAMVMRYDCKGNEKQQIEFDNNNTALYSLPQFVTESANLNIITSDRTAVVAVDLNGGKRWSYSGPTKTGSGFLPTGICCDMLLNIAVVDIYSNNVYLLDRDGEFLGRLLVLGNSWIPQGLCFDEENRLYCGDRSRILVYKYEHTMA
ncbi:uncharacterized protein LOC125663897 [Ostrea edulis]|uniref:uncharacterized protein LOC125663897 n=1 Tax=Ostrea edulis TaxID=37623 RepID=UPI002095D700|nr:uncharacterized protein LOC125663897 [Ostrea edulis]